jgi:tetratricopeptide (TPR) repeat protein
MVELVKADDIFTEAKCLLEGKKVDGSKGPKNLRKSEELLNELLNNNIGNPMVLYVLGSLYMECGNFGLAIQLLSQVTQVNPTFGEAWNNMAMAYRGANEWDRAVLCCTQAAKYIDNPDIPCNLSGLHLNRHMPETALKYAEVALEQDPNHVKAKWHKAIGLLELRRWEEAWPLHEIRLEGGANYNIASRNYHGEEMTPWWDGKSKGTVVIHGEQGMGDEIMFSSCINEAIATGADIILEPSPRLERLFTRTFPEAIVYGTNDTDGRAWVAGLGKPDFKCAVGSLPKFYRRNDKDFLGTPYLIPDPDKQAWWGDKLKALGRKPKIGLAWQGGVQSTRNDARSFHPTQFQPLFEAHDVSWVSLQYDQSAQKNVEDVRNQLGVEIDHWPKAVEAVDPETGTPSDLDELAALISRLDMVVSVCQTAIHFAGALGVPCLCLTPSQPSWRYSAVESEVMPWYSSVTLIRQAVETTDWTPVIAEANDRLGKFLGNWRATG